jgi:hypothetical protein
MYVKIIKAKPSTWYRSEKENVIGKIFRVYKTTLYIRDTPIDIFQILEGKYHFYSIFAEDAIILRRKK